MITPRHSHHPHGHVGVVRPGPPPIPGGVPHFPDVVPVDAILHGPHPRGFTIAVAHHQLRLVGRTQLPQGPPLKVDLVIGHQIEPAVFRRAPAGRHLRDRGGVHVVDPPHHPSGRWIIKHPTDVAMRIHRPDQPTLGVEHLPPPILQPSAVLPQGNNRELRQLLAHLKGVAVTRIRTRRTAR